MVEKWGVGMKERRKENPKRVFIIVAELKCFFPVADPTLTITKETEEKGKKPKRGKEKDNGKTTVY